MQDPIRGDVYTYFGSIGACREKVEARLGEKIVSQRFTEALSGKVRKPSIMRIRAEILQLIAEAKAAEQ